MNTEAGWLLVDDDVTFLTVLARALKRQGIAARSAHSASQALAVLEEVPIRRCILDLNLAGDSGLRLLPVMLQRCPDLRVLVLTGYGSIATAVEAMRLGAWNYRCKPVSVAEIIEAFAESTQPAPIRRAPPSVEELEWEHIQQVLNRHDGNVSATARALNMHRRTLQRKLRKHSRWRQ